MTVTPRTIDYPALDHTLRSHNVMPWFRPKMTAHLDKELWDDATDALSGKFGLPVAESFTIVRPTLTILGAGSEGMKKVEMPDQYYPMIWSNKVVVLSPDVLVLFRARRPEAPSNIELVHDWLYSHKILTRVQPECNDLYIANKKFMGTHVFNAPARWLIEVSMLTMKMDKELFKEKLPKKYRTGRRGHGLTGLMDEVDIDIIDALPKLYEMAKEAEHDK